MSVSKQYQIAVSAYCRYSIDCMYSDIDIFDQNKYDKLYSEMERLGDLKQQEKDNAKIRCDKCGNKLPEVVRDVNTQSKRARKVSKV